MKNKSQILGLHLMLVASILLAGCGSSESDTTPTPNVTQAYQTVEARLTEASARTPAATPTTPPTNTPPPPPSPTSTLAVTNTTAPTNTTGAVASTCDVAAAGNPIDVTIPDDTQMTPGKTFTKTWRLQNAGTCTWTKSYTIALFSGDGMGAAGSISLPADVSPGQSVDISVDMIAPATAGTYQGNWKLRNASNVFFGIGPGGGSPFWVRIVVSTSLTSVATTSASTTITPTTPQPGGVQASGQKTMANNDGIDLDGSLAGSQRDFIYLADSVKNEYYLSPVNNAVFGTFGASKPSQSDCQAAAKSGSNFSLLTQGNTYLCYQTDSGLIGWLYLEFFNINNLEVTVQYLTWAG